MNEVEKWGQPVETAEDRWLVELWSQDREERAWLLHGQTAEHRAAVAAFFAECDAAAQKAELARVVDATDTRDETPAPKTARVLFPVWEAQEPLADALRLAVARANLEAA
jgi:hypothetical protein